MAQTVLVSQIILLWRRRQRPELQSKALLTNLNGRFCAERSVVAPYHACPRKFASTCVRVWRTTFAHGVIGQDMWWYLQKFLCFTIFAMLFWHVESLQCISFCNRQPLEEVMIITTNSFSNPSPMFCAIVHDGCRLFNFIYWLCISVPWGDSFSPSSLPCAQKRRPYWYEQFGFQSAHILINNFTYCHTLGAWTVSGIYHDISL